MARRHHGGLDGQVGRSRQPLTQGAYGVLQRTEDLESPRDEHGGGLSDNAARIAAIQRQTSKREAAMHRMLSLASDNIRAREYSRAQSVVSTGDQYIHRYRSGDLLLGGTGMRGEDVFERSFADVSTEVRLWSGTRTNLDSAIARVGGYADSTAQDTNRRGMGIADAEAAFDRQMEPLKNKSQFLQVIADNQDVVGEAKARAQQAASLALQKAEQFEAQSKGMSFDARVRARRRMLKVKDEANALEQVAKEAQMAASLIKEHVVQHGLEPEPYFVELERRRALQAKADAKEARRIQREEEAQKASGGGTQGKESGVLSRAERVAAARRRRNTNNNGSIVSSPDPNPNPHNPNPSPPPSSIQQPDVVGVDGVDGRGTAETIQSKQGGDGDGVVEVEDGSEEDDDDESEKGKKVLTEWEATLNRGALWTRVSMLKSKDRVHEAHFAQMQAHDTYEAKETEIAVSLADHATEAIADNTEWGLSRNPTALMFANPNVINQDDPVTSTTGADAVLNSTLEPDAVPPLCRAWSMGVGQTTCPGDAKQCKHRHYYVSEKEQALWRHRRLAYASEADLSVLNSIAERENLLTMLRSEMMAAQGRFDDRTGDALARFGDVKGLLLLLNRLRNATVQTIEHIIKWRNDKERAFTAAAAALEGGDGSSMSGCGWVVKMAKQGRRLYPGSTAFKAVSKRYCRPADIHGKKEINFTVVGVYATQVEALRVFEAETQIEAARTQSSPSELPKPKCIIRPCGKHCAVESDVNHATTTRCEICHVKSFNGTFRTSPPYMWNGHNYLAKIIKDLDFLDRSVVLKRFLGDSFPLARNPFVTWRGLDPAAPPRANPTATATATSRKAASMGRRIRRTKLGTPKYSFGYACGQHELLSSIVDLDEDDPGQGQGQGNDQNARQDSSNEERFWGKLGLRTSFGVPTAPIVSYPNNCVEWFGHLVVGRVVRIGMSRVARPSLKTDVRRIDGIAGKHFGKRINILEMNRVDAAEQALLAEESMVLLATNAALKRRRGAMDEEREREEAARAAQEAADASDLINKFRVRGDHNSDSSSIMSTGSSTGGPDSESDSETSSGSETEGSKGHQHTQHHAKSDEAVQVVSDRHVTHGQAGGDAGLTGENKGEKHAQGEVTPARQKQEEQQQQQHVGPRKVGASNGKAHTENDKNIEPVLTKEERRQAKRERLEQKLLARHKRRTKKQSIRTRAPTISQSTALLPTPVSTFFWKAGQWLPLQQRRFVHTDKHKGVWCNRAKGSRWASLQLRGRHSRHYKFGRDLVMKGRARRLARKRLLERLERSLVKGFACNQDKVRYLVSKGRRIGSQAVLDKCMEAEEFINYIEFCSLTATKLQSVVRMKLARLRVVYMFSVVALNAVARMRHLQECARLARESVLQRLLPVALRKARVRVKKPVVTNGAVLDGRQVVVTVYSDKNHDSSSIANQQDEEHVTRGGSVGQLVQSGEEPRLRLTNRCMTCVKADRTRVVRDLRGTWLSVRGMPVCTDAARHCVDNCVHVNESFRRVGVAASVPCTCPSNAIKQRFHSAELRFEVYEPLTSVKYTLFTNESELRAKVVEMHRAFGAHAVPKAVLDLSLLEGIGPVLQWALSSQTADLVRTLGRQSAVDNSEVDSQQPPLLPRALHHDTTKHFVQEPLTGLRVAENEQRIARLLRATSCHIDASLEETSNAQETESNHRAEYAWQQAAFEGAHSQYLKAQEVFLACQTHYHATVYLAEKALGFSKLQLALLQDLNMRSNEQSWDPKEDATNPIYLQRKWQASRAVILARELRDNARRRKFQAEQLLHQRQHQYQDAQRRLNRAEERYTYLLSVKEMLERAMNQIAHMKHVWLGFVSKHVLKLGHSDRVPRSQTLRLRDFVAERAAMDQLEMNEVGAPAWVPKAFGRACNLLFSGVLQVPSVPFVRQTKLLRRIHVSVLEDSVVGSTCAKAFPVVHSLNKFAWEQQGPSNKTPVENNNAFNPVRIYTRAPDELRLYEDGIRSVPQLSDTLLDGSVSVPEVFRTPLENMWLATYDLQHVSRTAPFVSMLIVRAYDPATSRQWVWRVDPIDLRNLLVNSHEGLPGHPIPRVFQVPLQLLHEARTIQDKRHVVQVGRTMVTQRLAELVHMDQSGKDLKLGKLRYFRRRRELCASLFGTRWWRDIQNARTSLKGTEVYKEGRKIGDIYCLVSIYENMGDLTLFYSYRSLAGGDSLHGQSGAVQLRNSDVVGAIGSNKGEADFALLALWRQSVKCCRYPAVLMRRLLDHLQLVRKADLLAAGRAGNEHGLITEQQGLWDPAVRVHMPPMNASKELCMVWGADVLNLRFILHEQVSLVSGHEAHIRVHATNRHDMSVEIVSLQNASVRGFDPFAVPAGCGDPDPKLTDNGNADNDDEEEERQEQESTSFKAGAGAALDQHEEADKGLDQQVGGSQQAPRQATNTSTRSDAVDVDKGLLRLDFKRAEILMLVKHFAPELMDDTLTRAKLTQFASRLCQLLCIRDVRAPPVRILDVAFLRRFCRMVQYGVPLGAVSRAMQLNTEREVHPVFQNLILEGMHDVAVPEGLLPELAPPEHERGFTRRAVLSVTAPDEHLRLLFRGRAPTNQALEGHVVEVLEDKVRGLKWGDVAGQVSIVDTGDLIVRVRRETDWETQDRVQRCERPQMLQMDRESWLVRVAHRYQAELRRTLARAWGSFSEQWEAGEAERKERMRNEVNTRARVALELNKLRVQVAESAKLQVVRSSGNDSSSSSIDNNVGEQPRSVHDNASSGSQRNVSIVVPFLSSSLSWSSCITQLPLRSHTTSNSDQGAHTAAKSEMEAVNESKSKYESKSEDAENGNASDATGSRKGKRVARRGVYGARMGLVQVNLVRGTEEGTTDEHPGDYLLVQMYVPALRATAQARIDCDDIVRERLALANWPARRGTVAAATRHLKVLARTHAARVSAKACATSCVLAALTKLLPVLGNNTRTRRGQSDECMSDKVIRPTASQHENHLTKSQAGVSLSARTGRQVWEVDPPALGKAIPYRTSALTNDISTRKTSLRSSSTRTRTHKYAWKGARIEWLRLARACSRPIERPYAELFDSESMGSAEGGHMNYFGLRVLGDKSVMYGKGPRTGGKVPEVDLEAAKLPRVQVRLKAEHVRVFAWSLFEHAGLSHVPMERDTVEFVSGRLVCTAPAAAAAATTSTSTSTSTSSTSTSTSASSSTARTVEDASLPITSLEQANKQGENLSECDSRQTEEMTGRRSANVLEPVICNLVDVLAEHLVLTKGRAWDGSEDNLEIDGSMLSTFTNAIATTSATDATTQAQDTTAVALNSTSNPPLPLAARITSGTETMLPARVSTLVDFKHDQVHFDVATTSTALLSTHPRRNQARNVPARKRRRAKVDPNERTKCHGGRQLMSRNSLPLSMLIRACANMLAGKFDFQCAAFFRANLDVEYLMKLVIEAETGKMKLPTAELSELTATATSLVSSNGSIDPERIACLTLKVMRQRSFAWRQPLQGNTSAALSLARGLHLQLKREAFKVLHKAQGEVDDSSSSSSSTVVVVPSDESNVGGVVEKVRRADTGAKGDSGGSGLQEATTAPVNQRESAGHDNDKGDIEDDAGGLLRARLATWQARAQHLISWERNSRGDLGRQYGGDNEGDVGGGNVGSVGDGMGGMGGGVSGTEEWHGMREQDSFSERCRGLLTADACEVEYLKEVYAMNETYARDGKETYFELRLLHKLLFDLGIPLPEMYIKDLLRSFGAKGINRDGFLAWWFNGTGRTLVMDMRDKTTSQQARKVNVKFLMEDKLEDMKRRKSMAAGLAKSFAADLRRTKTIILRKHLTKQNLRGGKTRFKQAGLAIVHQLATLAACCSKSKRGGRVRDDMPGNGKPATAANAKASTKDEVAALTQANLAKRLENTDGLSEFQKARNAKGASSARLTALKVMTGAVEEQKQLDAENERKRKRDEQVAAAREASQMKKKAHLEKLAKVEAEAAEVAAAKEREEEVLKEGSEEDKKLVRQRRKDEWLAKQKQDEEDERVAVAAKAKRLEEMEKEMDRKLQNANKADEEEEEEEESS